MIRTPSHVKAVKGGGHQLKTAALKSKPGTDDVSVMRHRHLGFDGCRDKARPMSGYFGLAVLTPAAVRGQKSNVIDTREEYLGHASIVHGVVLPIDEPPDSKNLEELNERIRQILKSVRFEPDPDINSAHWTGPTLID
ncbi:hypothetical protein [Ideonella sp.]|uniref:hypothetical protein n=1 Tax=Ideonella sp. TaxID=1929293 RepID=UPI0035AEFFB1